LLGSVLLKMVNATEALQASAPTFASTVPKGDIPKEYSLRHYYTTADVAKHGYAHDCWVSSFGKVLDLTPLLAEYDGPLAQPLIEAAGTDISHWFDEASGGATPKRHIDPASGLEDVYCPWGRYIHVPPQGSASTCELPWWEDTRYYIGSLGSRQRKVTLVNLLTKQKHTFAVPVEETVEEIRSRYLVCNAHAGSYTWKRLGKVLNMEKTLEENGITDETEEFLRLNIDPDDHIPVIHLYFDDDLTEA